MKTKNIILGISFLINALCMQLLLVQRGNDEWSNWEFTNSVAIHLEKAPMLFRFLTSPETRI